MSLKRIWAARAASDGFCACCGKHYPKGTVVVHAADEFEYCSVACAEEGWR